MRAVLVGLVGAVLLGGAAQAETSVYRTKTKDTIASLTITTDDAGQTVGKYDLNAHGCLGEVSGRVVRDGAAEVLLSPHGSGAGICKISITRNSTSVVAHEDDSGDCSYFRGASCEFAQVLSRRR